MRDPYIPWVQSATGAAAPLRLAVVKSVERASAGRGGRAPTSTRSSAVGGTATGDQRPALGR